ncbi:MAG: hypothetical protein IIZ47_02110, partial [Erysipelotrichaceae bacterium]|nr:hypothetical protein [Erysipelotrichaceae bacterium]
IIRQDEKIQSLVRELPEEKIPVIICGASFNSDTRQTRMSEEGKRILDGLLERLDPDKVFFLVGHRFRAYEKYILTHNTRHFDIYAIVPSLPDEKTAKLIRKYRPYLRFSTESSGMSLYKSFNYEIFERRPSVLIAFDGNSAAANLIQEARNGKNKARIYVYEHCHILKEKALSLEGYVTLFRKKEDVLEKILTDIEETSC